MNRVELHEHLAETVERNPFIEVDRNTHGSQGSGPQQQGWDVPEMPSDARKSLYRHIADQFSLVFNSERDIQIALAFLQEIEPSGWLSTQIESIAEEGDFDLVECQNVLVRLQTLEPTGIFARGLKECLRLQAIERRLLDDVMEALIEHLDQLMTSDCIELAQRLDADPQQVACCLEHIRRMDPKPGSAFTFDETITRSSDVILTVVGQNLEIDLNKSSFPTVRLSHEPSVGEQGKSPYQAALNELIREAKTLKTAVDMRKSTTLAVVSAIFVRQRNFISQGYPALSPMRMSEIADDISVSEATVSRVISGLTILCPQGNISAKSLFCEPIEYCGELRTKHVALQMIKDLVAVECKCTPLNDAEITRKIRKAGLSLSRRTVAKYRQSLRLGPPGLRRKHAELAAMSRSVRATSYANSAK